MIARDVNADKGKYLVDNFKHALEEGWIEVYYQPIIRASNGRVCGEEALVRWDDPMLGVLNAAEFVPVLEAVNLIQDLDLYVLEQVLSKMEFQMESGLFFVPTSINVSQIDFFSCNIVEEFQKRVDASKIPSSNIAVEISASTIGSNEQVINQLRDFTERGFKIWMDDYGFGGTSLLTLKLVKFDLLKINMFYTSQLSDHEIRILVSELIRLALSMGVETAAECIENQEQIDFLKEVGCSKMQGFFYCRPISREQIFDRYRDGKAIGFENPDENEYYETIGKINLYDLSFIKDEQDVENTDDYFDSIPIAIVELDNDSARILRENQPFKKFMNNTFKGISHDAVYKYEGKEGTAGFYTMSHLKKCAKTGKREIIDDVTLQGNSVQMLIKRIAYNSIKDITALAVVITYISEKKHENDMITYNYIARALSEDYAYMYFVDNETGEYMAYTTKGLDRDISIERKGFDFWDNIEVVASKKIYHEDMELFLTSFTRKNVMRSIKETGSFKLAYRMVGEDGRAFYVSMKAVRARSGKDKIIIGVNDIDEQMRQKEEMDRIKEERLSFARVSALSGDFIAIYTVNPKDCSYTIYKSTSGYEHMNFGETGVDFFEDSRRRGKHIIYSEDLDGFIKVFNQNFVMEQIFQTGIFVYNYRMNFDGIPKYVCLKAALVEEEDAQKLIVGVIDVDHQVRKELEYAENLLIAENKASRDELTGVKNKHAYVDCERNINELLKKYPESKIAVAVCDINGLKEVNDTMGHQAGDEFIKSGCEIVCKTFSHSPVYRIGGDEFAVVIQGEDYDRLDSLCDKMKAINDKNMKMGIVTVAFGVAENKTDKFLADIFKRADNNMYEMKGKMKEKMATIV